MHTPEDYIAKAIVSAGPEIAKQGGELVKQIYANGGEPGVKSTGEALKDVVEFFGSLIGMGADWSRQKRAFYSARRFLKYAEKLSDIPPENRQAPPPLIAGPAFEHGQWIEDDEELIEMFDNIVVASMDSRRTHKIRPAFVSILKQITSDEAKIIKWAYQVKVFPVIEIRSIPQNRHRYSELADLLSLAGHKSGCVYPEESPSYLANLVRLGLIIIKNDTLAGDTSYDELLYNPWIISLVESVDISSDREISPKLKGGGMTVMGKQLYRACARTGPGGIEID